MESIIKELWHGNIIPQEDGRTSLPEMKELLNYMARYHEDLEKSFTVEHKEIFGKCCGKNMSTLEFVDWIGKVVKMQQKKQGLCPCFVL